MIPLGPKTQTHLSPGFTDPPLPTLRLAFPSVMPHTHAHLRVTSVLRMHKLAAVERSVVVRRLARLGPQLQGEVDSHPEEWRKYSMPWPNMGRWTPPCLIEAVESLVTEENRDITAVQEQASQARLPAQAAKTRLQLVASRTTLQQQLATHISKELSNDFPSYEAA
jgi:hypothetical protein